MKSNLTNKQLGKYIREIDVRNKDLSVDRLLGVSNEKYFIPSIANIIGTDLSSYKIVKQNQFAFGPVTSRNGDKLSIALLTEKECIVSSSYIVFEIIDTKELDPNYLLMWFKRPEFDRYVRFMSHGSVREIFDFNKICEVELIIPSIEEQRKIVSDYKIIEDRISIKQAINNNLLLQISELFKSNISNELMSLRNFPSVQEVKSGIKSFEGFKKYFATGDIDFDKYLDSFEQIEFTNRPSRANMQPINNSIWFAKMQYTKKVLFFNEESKINDLILSTGFMGIKLDESYLYYLLAFIYSKDFEDQKDKYATGTTQLAINSTALDKILIPLPKTNLIVLNNKMKKYFINIQLNNKEIEHLTKLAKLCVNRIAILK